MDYGKVVWAAEAATRILEEEGLTDEANFVAQRYTQDGIVLRDKFGSQPVPKILPSFPVYNQLLDPTWDGSNQNKFNNCGPASVGMCTQHLTGVRLWDDDTLDAMLGPTYTGYTTVGQLAKFMTERCNIPNSGPVYDQRGIERIVEAISNRHPVIVLYYFNINDHSSGHFCPVYGFDGDGVWRANPWGGSYEYQTWGTFSRWYKGWTIECYASRYYGGL